MILLLVLIGRQSHALVYLWIILGLFWMFYAPAKSFKYIIFILKQQRATVARLETDSSGLPAH